MNRLTYLLFFLSVSLAIFAQDDVVTSDTIPTMELDEVVIQKKRAGNMKLSGAENKFTINQTELFRAACCNLGESFTTNPSVDVTYSDPATGAKQIKLLGLSGSYVQLLTENMPNFRGASRPYALRYVPGPWMKSISVSKGSSSVKNGFESMTGQIDIEYLKPDDPQGVALNTYIDSDVKVEANADGNIKLSQNLSSEILAHFEDRYRHHDGNNDGFIDMPDIRQINIQNRWKYYSSKYIFHGGLGVIDERSYAGQISSHHGNIDKPYTINLLTNRYEAYMKHAVIVDRNHNGNIALMANGSLHDMDATYGYRGYDVKEWNGYAQLIYETDFTTEHSLSTGLSFNHDSFRQRLLKGIAPNAGLTLNEHENTVGGYAQYTWKPNAKLTAMAGVRGDHSTKYGGFVTPRCNVRYSPAEGLNIRGSAGKGYRSVFGWAEYNYLMASGRELIVENLNQEASWNYGINADYRWYIGAENILFNAEYYYTTFDRQVNVDYDSDPHKLTIGNLDGKSFSHTFQVDVTYESSFGLTITTAYRLNDVKTTYGGILMEKPLTSRYKGLLSVSYSTPMDIWQFDATLQVNGGGRMPSPYLTETGAYSWAPRFKSFPQLNVQATRWFRHFSIYAGGENLTNFRQKNPIIHSEDPWSPNFDSTMIWGPTTGAMAYVGIRFNFGKL